MQEALCLLKLLTTIGHMTIVKGTIGHMTPLTKGPSVT